MLHIIKQFVFGLQLSLKSDFQNSDQFNAAVSNLDSADEQEATKATLKISEFLHSLDSDKNDTLTEEERNTSNITSEQLKVLFEKIGLYIPRGSNEILLSAVRKSLSKFQLSRDITIRESQLSSEALKKEIAEITPDKFSDPILDTTAIEEGFVKMNKRGTFNFKTIGTYLHDGEQNNIVMKKDGKGKYYIELDDSVSGWGNDLKSETTDILTQEKVQQLVDELIQGNVVINTLPNTNQVIEDNSTDEVIKTKEQGVKGSQESVLGINTGNLDKQEVLNQVNIQSLANVLKNTSNISKLVDELKTALDTDNIALFTYTNVLGSRNYSDAMKILEREGYDSKGFIGTVEAKGVIGTINGVNETQKQIKSMQFRDKLAMIFDYNADGLLDSKGEFYTEELEIFKAVKTETKFENILRNLGYVDKAQFDSEFDENYYVAREKFKNLLAISLSGDYVLNPGLMISNPEAKSQLNQQLQVIDEQVTADLSMNEKVKELSKEYPTLAPQFQENVTAIAKGVYLQSIGGVVGGATGAAATFNIQSITSEILDTASVGVVNGVFGIQIGKEIFRSYDDKTSVSMGAVNFIPYVSASHEFYEEKVSGLTNIFQESEIDNGMKLNIGGSGAIGAGMLGVNYQKVDEETSAGRDQLKEQMSDMISDVLDNISEGKDFSELGLDDNEANREYYNQIQALYEATGSNNIAKQEIITGAANNYKRILAQKNEGFALTGATLGLVYTTLTGVLPAIGVHGEYSSVDWEKRRFVIDRIESVQGLENAGQIYESTKTNMEYILTDLSPFEDAFSHRTRWNTGAAEFLNPDISIEKRWEGLKQLANNTKILRDVNLSEYLDKNQSEGNDVKLSVISVLGAWTRRSNDVKNADTPDKLITLDSNRRAGFDNNFGFDVSEYAQDYYKILSQESEINTTQVHGSTFDAVSILNVEGQSIPKDNGDVSNKISGIDMLHGPLRMVADSEGNALKVEITNPDHIKAFAKSISSLSDNNGEKINELIQMIEEGNIVLYFYKDPDGFNDRIMPVIKESPVVVTQTESTKSVGVNAPQYNVIPWSLFAIPHTSNTDSKKDNQESTPGADENNDGAGGRGNPNPGENSGGRGGDPLPENTPVVSPNRVNNTSADMTNAGATILVDDIHKK